MKTLRTFCPIEYDSLIPKTDFTSLLPKKEKDVAKSPLEYTKFTRWTCVSNADLEGSLYILKGNEMISARNSNLKQNMKSFPSSSFLSPYSRIFVFSYFCIFVLSYFCILVFFVFQHKCFISISVKTFLGFSRIIARFWLIQFYLFSLKKFYMDGFYSI